MTNGDVFDAIEQRAFTDPEFFWLLMTDPVAALLDFGLERDSPEFEEALRILRNTLGEGHEGAKSWLHGLRIIGAWRK